MGTEGGTQEVGQRIAGGGVAGDGEIGGETERMGGCMGRAARSGVALKDGKGFGKVKQQSR